MNKYNFIKNAEERLSDKKLQENMSIGTYNSIMNDLSDLKKSTSVFDDEHFMSNINGLFEKTSAAMKQYITETKKQNDNL